MGSKIFKGILVIIMLAVIGGCIYLIVEKVNDRYGNKTTENNKTEEKKEESVETELTDNLVKQDVLDKMNVILGLNDEKRKYDSSIDYPINKLTIDNSFVSNSFNKMLDKEKVVINLLNNFSLTSEEKLSIALSKSNTSKMDKPCSETNISEKNMCNDYEEYFQKISIDELNSIYYQLFNEKPLNYTDIKKYGYFNYYYDSVDNCYYKFYLQIGGSGPVIYNYYISNINKKDDDVYVYLTHIISLGTSNIVCDAINYDLETSKCSSEISVDNATNYKIDESNYKEFTNYKFTFRKNSDGTYYFDKVEKVES